MILRGLVFSAWALVGGVLSYGLLYLLSPFGLIIVTACILFALALPTAGGIRWPEALGLPAGPGLLLLLAAEAGDDMTLGGAGAAILAAAVVAYTLVGRAQCARVT